MDRNLKILLGLFVSGALFTFLTRPSRAADNVLVVGDSLSAGSYPERLGVPVQTFSFEGKGARHALENTPWSSALAGKSHVVVQLGVNDLASRRDLGGVEASLSKIYETARRFGVTVIGVGVTPWAGHVRASGKLLETRKLNEWVRANADVYVDTRGLGRPDGSLRQRFDAGDGLHLTEQGQAALAALIREKLK